MAEITREHLELAALAAGHEIVCTEAEMHGCEERSAVYAGVMLCGGPRLVRTPEQIDAEKQAIIDQFAAQHGPCCAGCDYWRWHNSVVGDCLRTAPVAGHDRVALPGVTGCSAPIGSGHIMTPREHWCGEFKRVDGGAA